MFHSHTIHTTLFRRLFLIAICAFVLTSVLATPVKAQTDNPPPGKKSCEAVLDTQDDAAKFTEGFVNANLVPNQAGIAGSVRFDGFGLCNPVDVTPINMVCSNVVVYKVGEHGEQILWTNQSTCVNGQLVLQGEGKGRFILYQFAKNATPPQRVLIQVE
jgi:hypothetical protein